jgi:dihydroxyacetone kinase phosphoprotein-dependent L subunit
VSRLPNADGAGLVAELAEVIVANKAYLSEIDGLIGDGDHGVNMAKGFGRAAERTAGRNLTLDEGMAELADVLLSEIGGSMGPLYGLMFTDMSETIAGEATLDAARFGAMLRAGLEGVQGVGAAKVGDKTLIDCLQPAVEAWEAHADQGFEAAAIALKSAAERGRDSTVDLVAKIGRSARLGERSRGVLDAGATSCCLILTALADGAVRRLAA